MIEKFNWKIVINPMLFRDKNKNFVNTRIYFQNLHMLIL